MSRGKDEIAVRRSCQLVLIGSLALTSEAHAMPLLFGEEPNDVVNEASNLLDSGMVRAKTRANCKKNLAAAKAAKRDEFYTQYKDIKRELDLYYSYNEDVFRDKVVFMPCDNPLKSNFNKYLLDNFGKFGIKRLVCSCYNPDGKGLLFDYDGTQKIDRTKNDFGLSCRELSGNGDFRSDEVCLLCKEADIIVTNPPFSLFRHFFSWVISSGKQFIIIGNVNCISYKEVYPRIMNNEVWLGHGIGRWISGFIVPDDYELYGSEAFVNGNGERIVSSNSCLWLTNVDHGRRHVKLQLMTMEENIHSSRHKDVRGVGYVKYDNCDAIEVPHTDAIPSDYDGLMGVPITFLDKYCPEQFELVRFRKGDDGQDLRIGSKTPYFRILIRKRH